MKIKKWLSTIDAHTEGEAVRLVIGGIPYIPGKTMSEKRDFFSQRLDHLGSALLHEPRGHESMFVVIMTPPVSDNAAFGVVFLAAPKLYIDMCVHGSIGVATIAVEMGLVEPTEPVTEVVFDTPAGTIHARVSVEDGKAKSTTVQNVPSFLYREALIKVPSLGELQVDIVYGGNFYGIVEAREIGVEPTPDGIARAENLLTEIKLSINQQVQIRHPELDFIKDVHYLIINDKPRNPKADILNIATAGRGKIMDRSPCGTGTSAKMAALWAKGELSLTETYTTESVIGTLYYGKLTEKVRVGNFKAVVPEITGRAFVTGMHNFVIDDDDPFKYGFLL